MFASCIALRWQGFGAFLSRARSTKRLTGSLLQDGRGMWMSRSIPLGRSQSVDDVGDGCRGVTGGVTAFLLTGRVGVSVRCFDETS